MVPEGAASAEPAAAAETAGGASASTGDGTASPSLVAAGSDGACARAGVAVPEPTARTRPKIPRFETTFRIISFPSLPQLRGTTPSRNQEFNQAAGPTGLDAGEVGVRVPPRRRMFRSHTPRRERNHPRFGPEMVRGAGTERGACRALRRCTLPRRVEMFNARRRDPRGRLLHTRACNFPQKVRGRCGAKGVCPSSACAQRAVVEVRNRRTGAIEG